jgi:phospholipid/cholesterol/gamma-HCH transport system substrate-binding protein
MSQESRRRRGIDPIWWTPVLVAVIVAISTLTAMAFEGTLKTTVPLTVISDRAGLVMEDGAKVKLRGVQIGEVDHVESYADAAGTNLSKLKLKMSPNEFRYLPSNVEAEIKSSTAFGAKYVDLIVPEGGATVRPLAKGAVLRSRNVTVEVNTVFENLESIVRAIDPAKLNGVLSALSDAFRGKGDRMGQAITEGNKALLAVNPKQQTIRKDWQLFGKTTEAYSVAAQDILSTLDAFSTTSVTITKQKKALNEVLLDAIGFSNAGINTIGRNEKSIVDAINLVAPTFELLNKYSPTYKCTFEGAVWYLENGGRAAMGGNGKSLNIDGGLLFGDDPYRYPDNLPIVQAKGGPGGRPSCGSLPDASANFPVKYLVTDTGFGTGLDIRPNPGIGFPGYNNYFPVTKGTPQPPLIRYPGGPAPGLAPAYPGQPPSGAPDYAGAATPPLPPAPPPAP